MGPIHSVWGHVLVSFANGFCSKCQAAEQPVPWSNTPILLAETEHILLACHQVQVVTFHYCSERWSDMFKHLSNQAAT